MKEIKTYTVKADIFDSEGNEIGSAIFNYLPNELVGNKIQQVIDEHYAQPFDLSLIHI